MKSFIKTVSVCLLLALAMPAFAGRSGGSYSSGSSSRSFSSSSFSSSRSYSSPSSSSRSFSSPSFSRSTTPSTASKSFSSPSFSASKPTTTSPTFTSPKFTPSRPVSPAPYSGSRSYNGYSYSRPGTVVEHHYYNNGPGFGGGNFWFWMWAFDHGNNGGYQPAYGGVNGAVAAVPGTVGGYAPVVAYTPLWERTLVVLLNILVVAAVLWLLCWGLYRLSKAMDI